MNTIILIDDTTLDILAVVETALSKEEAHRVILGEKRRHIDSSWTTSDLIEAIEGKEIEVESLYV